MSKTELTVHMDVDGSLYVTSRAKNGVWDAVRRVDDDTEHLDYESGDWSGFEIAPRSDGSLPPAGAEDPAEIEAAEAYASLKCGVEGSAWLSTRFLCGWRKALNSDLDDHGRRYWPSMVPEPDEWGGWLAYVMQSEEES